MPCRARVTGASVRAEAFAMRDPVLQQVSMVWSRYSLSLLPTPAAGLPAPPDCPALVAGKGAETMSARPTRSRAYYVCRDPPM